MKKLTALILALALMLSCAALAELDLSTKNKIALSTIMTGATAEVGKMTSHAAQLAVDQFNAEHGTSFVLEVYDDKADPTEAVNIATLLLDDPSVIAVSPCATGTTMAAAPMFQDAGLMCFSHAASGADVPGIGDLVFSIAISQKYEGAKFADAIFETLGGAKKLAVLYQAVDQSYQNSNLLVSRYEELGGEKIYMEMFEVGTTDFSPMLSAIKESGAEVLYVAGDYVDTANCFLQARALEMDIALVSSGTAACQGFLDIAGSQLNGSYVVTTIPSFSQETLASMPNPNENMINFAADFEAAFGFVPDGYAAQAYDCMVILMNACLETGSTDSADIAAYLAALAGYDGVSGFNMMYNDQKELNKDAILFEVQDGAFLHRYP